MSGNTQKLAVLRARTDHDLLVLVRQELDRGFALAAAASTAQAERAYTKAAALLARIAGPNQGDRPALEARLAGLRTQLDQTYSAGMRWSASVA